MGFNSGFKGLICHKSTVVHTQYIYIAGSGHVAQQHTHRMHSCVSTATMVTPTRPIATLHVHCRSWYIYDLPGLSYGFLMGWRIPIRHGRNFIRLK